MTGGVKILLGIAVGTVLFGLTSSLAWADGWSGCRGGRGHAVEMTRHGMSDQGGTTHRVLHHLLRHQKDIGLTDEQVTKLRTLALDQDRARIRAHAEVMVAERELRALVADEKTELSAIEAKVKEREALEGNLRLIGIKAKRALFAVLTAEQREKQKALLDQIRHSHRERMMKAEGWEQGDYEMTAEGIAPGPETGSHDAGGGHQAS
ncbi:MAG: Spy/CpxP family protein refolding chaperone [Nitrospiraceae bacterium]